MTPRLAIECVGGPMDGDRMFVTPYRNLDDDTWSPPLNWDIPLPSSVSACSLAPERPEDWQRPRVGRYSLCGRYKASSFLLHELKELGAITVIGVVYNWQGEL